jgi:hypothetical protein
MKFEWRVKGSFEACVCAIFTRMTLKGMSEEKAMQESIPRHSFNHEEIPDRELQRIRFALKEVQKGKMLATGSEQEEKYSGEIAS